MASGIYRFQDVIASANFTCGVSDIYDPAWYVEPADSSCRVATQIQLSSGDYNFFHTDATKLMSFLDGKGHETEKMDPNCQYPRHCCQYPQQGYDAMAWFDAHPRCGEGGSGRTGCHTLDETGSVAAALQ